ncbi:hypothetical protein MNBD_GAMMA23-104 [hydrothermal vent metagenome]|uniref:Uncharacterized protein n=1 Tax=hydrothermal vent metagenome TaxID=652676 RepID=A0A3B1A0R3_9ZZZZ
MPNKTINSQLNQKSKAKSETRQFEIFNDKHIQVTTNNLVEEKSFSINLGLLEPWPVRHRKISIAWLAAVLYFFISTIIYIFYLTSNINSGLLGKLMPLIVIFILATIASLIMFYYRSPNVTEFRSRYAGCVLLSFLYNKPTPEIFEKFIDEMRARILTASQNIKMDKRRMLVIELKELDRLKNEGILDEQRIKQAHQRVQHLNFTP